MSGAWSRGGKFRILLALTILHLMCHGLLTLLVPLLLCLQADFGLPGVEPVTALITWQAVTFALAGLGAGWLADKVGGKPIAGLGLMLQGLGLIGLAHAPTLAAARLWVIVAGVGSAGYHPVAAKHLVTLFPRSVGKAIGIAAIGAGVGFWLGPRFAGWRAEQAGWQAPLWSGAAWRVPILEAGIVALAVAALYLLLTAEPAAEEPPPVGNGPSRPLALGVIFSIGLLGLVLIPRDFGSAGIEALNSLFLQRVHGLGVQATGALIAAKGLISLVANPLATWLSDRGPRLVWWAGVTIAGAVFAALIPLLAPGPAGVVLVAHGVCVLAGYPILESAIAETVPARLRGRAAAVLLAVVGLPGAFAAKLVGGWVDRLGSAAVLPREGFVGLYAALSGLLLVSLLAAVALRGVRRRADRYRAGKS